MEERKAGAIGYITGRWPLDPTKSTIIFLHGAGGSSAFWQAQVEGLAGRTNTLALDLPGHGRSAGNGKDNIADYASTVAEFIDNINAPGPVLCGLSMGGAIALMLLLDYPGRFRAGILISTGARLKVAPVIFETIEKDYNGFIDMVGEFAASKKTDPDLVKSFKEDMAKCAPEITHGDFRACNVFDVMERLSAIDVPVRVVTAEDDPLTPPKFGETLEKSINKASRTHILDAGHIVPMEKPAEVNAAIKQFLDRNGL